MENTTRMGVTLETFSALPGSSRGCSSSSSSSSSPSPDGAVGKNKAFIVRGVSSTSFEILSTLAFGNRRRTKVSRVAMRPKAFNRSKERGENEDDCVGVLRCAINKDADAIAVTDGFTLVTYHRVSTGTDGDAEEEKEEEEDKDNDNDDDDEDEDAWVETESIALEKFENSTVTALAWSKRCDEIVISYASSSTASLQRIVRVEHIWNEEEQKSLRVGKHSDLICNVSTDSQFAPNLRCGDAVFASSSAETVRVYFGATCARIAHPKGSMVRDFLVLEDHKTVDEASKISHSNALIVTLASDDCVRFWNVECITNEGKDDHREFGATRTTSSLKLCVTNDETTSDGENAFTSFDVHEDFLLTVDASGFATTWLLSNIRGGDTSNRIAKVTRVRRQFALFNAPFYNEIPVSVMAKCTLIESQNRVAVEAIAYDGERIERSFGASSSSIATSISSGHSHALKKIVSNSKADKIGTLDESGKLKFWLTGGNANWTPLGSSVENVESFAWSNSNENVVFLLRRASGSSDDDGLLARVAFTDENVSELTPVSLSNRIASVIRNYDSLNVVGDDDILILTPRISGNVQVCSIKARQSESDTTLYECIEMVVASKTPRGSFDSVKSSVSGEIIACFDGSARTNFWRFDAENQFFDLLGYVSSSKRSVVSISPCGSRACVVNEAEKSVEVLDASGERDGKFTSVANFSCDNSEKVSGKLFAEWLDIGGGLMACLVAFNMKVIIVAPNTKLGEWTVAYSRTFEKVIACSAWKSNGESIIVSFDDGEILSLGTRAHASLARKIAELSSPLPCYHPAVLQDWIVRRKAHRARAAIRKVIAHLESMNNDVPAESTSSARSTISSILELENSNADDRPSTPRGKVISPRGAPSVSAFSSAPTPSLVPEFDMGAFGGFGGGSSSSSFTANRTSPNMFAPENLSRQNSLASESTSLFRQNSNSLDDSASTTTTYTSVATATGSSVSFSALEAETAADLFSRHADYLGLSSQEAIEVLGCLDALRDSDVGIEATVDQAGRRLHTLHRVRELTYGRQRGAADNTDVDVTGEELLWAAQCETGDAVIDAILHASSSAQIAWRDLRMLGIPIWLRNETTLKAILDKAARASFAKTKDPESCALLFVCLGRTSVLAGLYKAKRDQKLFEFLSRDFNEKRHQEAALKNAYALLSKHRYELSAAFFALAGQYEDAAKICLKHLNDVSLSIAILRCAASASSSSVIAKDGSYTMESEVSKFIREEILEDGSSNVDSLDAKWRLAAFYWMSGDCEKSVTMLLQLVNGDDTLSYNDTKKESHASKASALDLLTHITSRRRKVVDLGVLAACEKAVKTKSASVSRAFELAGMPLAALERLTNSRGKREGHDNSSGLKTITDDEDDVPEFEQVGGISPSKQKDSIDHAMELASTVVENFGLNDVVSPLRRSVSQLVNTGQFDFDGAFGWKLDPDVKTTSAPSAEAEQSNVPATPEMPASGEALKQKGSLSVSIEHSNGNEEENCIQHSDALKQRGVYFATKTTAARLAASALLVAFDENGSYVAKYSDVPDDAQACTEMLSRAPFDVEASMIRQSLARRAFTLQRSERTTNSKMTNFSKAASSDGLAEFFRSSVKRKVANAAATHIHTSSTKRAVSEKSDGDVSMAVLKKSVELARLSGDGFVDVCCNARETTELAVAAVRRGLVTVDLRELSKSGDGKRAPGVLSAAEAVRRATVDVKVSEPMLSLAELFGYSKKQNLWAEATVSLEDWNVSFAPKYAKRKKRMSSSSTATNVGEREPASPDAQRPPDTPSSAPKTPHLHDWGHELGVVIPAAAALSRQDSQSSPSSSPRFSLSGGKDGDSPADVSARVVVSHPSFPIFACGSANRGLQIWRFGFEETKKRFQLEIPKNSTSGGSGGTSSSSPVALSFNDSGERLACATTDGRVALYDSSSSLRTMASRLCVFDSNSNSSAFVAAKPKQVAFVSSMVCAIACESKSYSNGVTGGMMRSEKALADGNGVLLWDAAQPNSARCGVLYDTSGLTSVINCAAHSCAPSLFVASGNRNGEVVLHDLRKLSSSSTTSASTTALWRSAANASKITSLLHHADTNVLLSGDEKGDLRVSSRSDGRVLQSVDKAHDKHAFMAPRIGGASISVGLSSMCALDKGVLTAGGDGAVKLFRFL